VDQRDSHETERFEGRYYTGRGDLEYLSLLETARRMFEADPEFQNMSMLYTPNWNGLVEGPTWGAWWVQNSYGTTYSVLPFLREPFVTFLQNSQDLWFDGMGDGQRSVDVTLGDGKHYWTPPDGALCDCASPGWVIYKQGDGRVGIHDWGMEFTAAGLLMQAELLLIGRDLAAIEKYLPKLERCAEFLDTRRDPKNNLYLAGPAGNLLAPSFGGYKKPDGTYGMAYLTGLSITTIGAMDRLIELEKLAGREEKVEIYRRRRALSFEGLKTLTTEEGYFIRSLDPDGVKHGVYGSQRHGYFETSPNHDAIVLRVADDEQARKIYRKIASIPGLRPYDFIIPNYPAYDDMYEQPEGEGFEKLWSYGAWVNGGHWSTCEARMILAYYRVGQFEDIRKSMRQLLKFAKNFRMDNPLGKFGSEVTQPNEAINLCYDTLGPSAAMIRGLFEYIYSAESLVLVPHVPPTIEELHQKDPIRFGSKKIYLSTFGTGPITAVMVNGRSWSEFSGEKVTLPFEKTPEVAQVCIFMGKNATAVNEEPVLRSNDVFEGLGDLPDDLKSLAEPVKKVQAFIERLSKQGLSESYPAAHAVLVLRSVRAILERRKLKSQKKLTILPEPSQTAADQSYVDTAMKLYAGLEKAMKSYGESDDPQRRTIFTIWEQVLLCG